ncbi:MAG TPA: 6,7-dimethyl-8-ribityllumazine synthase [Bacteroidales bacterium]|jgi:6,7-dimethyl-8-ribityllumazine synthase|nr:6,7-dimethyl-8-ribityllumazine synthase [Bacteroidales bacterium]MDD4235332.1 6,7-dimethyl-8-ribityllumazine synthase [Bacteroidales bacterium]HRW22107.1 6,7-dimethyl-8-ribityllumazine synthase [Bacteroidales bacterium]HXK81504.1 6,7-dimethyl-8-ribityllumazine synthase [Bacteroidales bacterium]
MSSKLKNLSDYKPQDVPNGKNVRIGIVVAEWNPDVTNSLAEGAINTLLKFGVNENSIVLKYVPGSFELPLGAQFIIEAGKVDAVICLGCVIQGETRHFDFICQGVTQGIIELNLKYDLPIIFGVLTTNNQEQALDRAGGKHGNKGDEAAVAALKMIELKKTCE